MNRNTKAKLNIFCCNYVTLGNAEEAALKAGFPRENALTAGIELLKTKECQELIAQIRDILSDSGNVVVSGLKRLAFGSCADAIHLVFAEELPPVDAVAKLDLFNVAEIKRVKGGGVEIKLFDRMKALEKLFELQNSFCERDKAAGLIRAMTADEECENFESI